MSTTTSRRYPAPNQDKGFRLSYGGGETIVRDGETFMSGFAPRGLAAGQLIGLMRDAQSVADALFSEQPLADKPFADQRVVHAIAKALGVSITFENARAMEAIRG